MTTSGHVRGIRVFVVLPGLVVCQLMMIGCDSNPGGPDQVSALAVLSAVPNTGPTGSAAEVTISGTGFRAGATAAFDGVSASTVVVDSRTLKATAPPHPEGAVDIVVINPDRTSARLNGGYRYVPLAITAVTPSAAFVGTGLAITGTGFLPGAIVTLGGSQALNARVVNSLSINLAAPEHAPGAVDAVVTNPGGQTAILAGGFLYASVSLTVTPSSVMPGDELRVSWTTQATFRRFSEDWIGLFRVGESNFDDIGYQYTSGASGTQTWLAPNQPGQYEFRYLPDDGYVDVARSPVTVVGAAVVSDGTQTTSRRAGRGGAMQTRGR